MQKKSYLYFVVVLCMLTFPTVVKAAEYSYQYVDYHFIMQDDAGKNIEGLHFKLYDESKLFQFESEYNEEEDYYYFDVYTDDIDISASIPQEIREFSGPNRPNSCDIFASNFDAIVERYPDFSVGTKECHDYRYDLSTYSVNKIIPLVLEEESRNVKKIVFGYLHFNISFLLNSRYYKFILVNNESYKNTCKIQENHIQGYHYYWNDIRCRFFYDIVGSKNDTGLYIFSKNDSILSDLNEKLNNPDNHRDGSFSFMRNTVYDYTDELWEQLNNGPIASSEMNYDDSSVVLGSDGIMDLIKPSIIKFNQKDNDTGDNSNNEDDNINNIVNPKTWNNGIIILVISVLIVIGSSLIIINRKNSKT